MVGMSPTSLIFVLVVALLLMVVLCGAVVVRLRTAAARREVELLEQLRASAQETRTDEQLLEAAKAMVSDLVAEQSGRLVEAGTARIEAYHERADSLLGSHGRELREGLSRLDDRITQLEAARVRESTTLQAALAEVRTATEAARAEAGRLAAALTNSKVRGSWGEVSLRRIIEAAGMDARCDFAEQRTVGTDGATGRPDVIVWFPSDRSVVVDAKAPLDAFLRAANAADDSERDRWLTEHAKAVRGHVRSLAERRYADMVDGAIESVVMFLPGDAFLDAALSVEPMLFEEAWSRGVILATPTTLFGLLKTMAMAWQERRLADEAAEIAALGRELHDRIGNVVGHVGRLGKGLNQAVRAYNDTVGSIESRLIPTARRLESHGASSPKEVPGCAPLELVARTPAAYPERRSGESQAATQIGLEAAVGIDAPALLQPLPEPGVHLGEELGSHA
jgi:DNA recombination protein RmuC